MTNEAKAEEYVNNKYHCNQIECLNSCDYCYREESKHDYLNGLAAGRPKWHDLRKDPNDLPKENGEYWSNIGLVKFNHINSSYSWFTPLCEVCDDQEDVTDEVIAWCELPKFEE